MIDVEYVNAALVLVVVTCVVGPLLSQRFGEQVKAESVVEGVVDGSPSVAASRISP